MTDITPIIVLTLFVLAFGALLAWGTSLIGPTPKQSDLKKEPYECGIKPQNTGHTRVPVKFYLTAILFILFDIEIVFMYPWAVSFADSISAGYGLQALLAMGVFILVFIIGLIWEIKSKALDWD